MVDRGWCNGSTGSFGVPGRGSMPRPRARGPQPHATPRARQEVSAMTQYRPLSAVVLAAGEGTRMRSETPKVLHPLCGRPMLLHVIDALVALPLERIVVVVGHGAERVTKTLQEQLATEMPVEFVEQRVQRGTGDAASVALTAGVFDLDAEDDLLVVPGDAPLLRSETLAALAAVVAEDPDEAVGVNDRAQLAEVEAALRLRINQRWMREGVSMTDAERTYVDATVELEPDVQLLAGTMLEGRTVIGAGSVIGPDTHLVDTIIGERVVVRQTVANEAEIGDDATVGPFAHLRPRTRLGADVHIGNFVE